MTGVPEERSAGSAASKGIRSALAGIVVNGALALVKGIAGFLGNSYALIADAIESASDVVSSLIVVSGLRIAAKPRDENHPYGHGKAEPIAALVVALSLFGAAVTIILQSYHEIITPHHAPEPFTLIVLIIVVVVKEALFRSVFRVAEEVQSTAVRTDAWHHRSDAITSAAAFIGISAALIGGDGYESADDWAALFASVIIIYNAYGLFRPALDEIMDAAPPADVAERVRAAAATVPGVLGLEKCFVRKMGLDYFVDLHVIVDGAATVREGHRIGHDVKDAVCHALPRIADVMVHIEPDTFG
ncbi:MAG: cation transporter [Bacteroidetes bacterium]|nr:cation transporter [Bacteroidota bacterium]